MTTCPRCQKPAVIVYKDSGVCSVCESNQRRATGYIPCWEPTTARAILRDVEG